MTSPDVQRTVVRERPVAAPPQAPHQIRSGTIHLIDSAHFAAEKKFKKAGRDGTSGQGPPCLPGVPSLPKVQVGGEEDGEVEETKSRCQSI